MNVEKGENYLQIHVWYSLIKYAYHSINLLIVVIELVFVHEDKVEELL